MVTQRSTGEQLCCAARFCRVLAAWQSQWDIVQLGRELLTVDRRLWLQRHIHSAIGIRQRVLWRRQADHSYP
ncbi:hypothetical protein XACJK4_3170023 [Xanthomonas citri pv. citri]|nr:hypothetical protein XACJK4_3170023 [Xanthomonas citri pv. citri]